MAAITQTAKTEELIERIEKTIVDPNLIKATANGKFYIADKTEYSFDTYFVYDKGVFTKPTVDEIVYNLKEREYKLFRNEKEITFSEDNLRKSFCKMSAEEMSFFETDGNQGFYVKSRGFGRTGNEREQFIARQLINLIEEFPALEFVYKAGFDISKWSNKYNTEFRYLNPKAHNLCEFFGFNYKLQLKLLREMEQLDDSNKSRFLILRKMELDDLVQLRDILGYIKTNNKKYGLNKATAIFNFFGLNSYYGYNSKFNLHDYDDVIFNIERFIEYLFYEADVKQAFERPNTYVDYIKMSKELGAKFERYPASINTAHDIAARYYNMIRYNGELRDKFKTAVACLSDYEGDIKNSKYTIVAPKDVQDIIQEGIELSHCVKSYIPAIADEKTAIVFLRAKNLPEVPLYTIEIKDNVIVQAAGSCNCELEDEAKEALEAFAEGFMLGVNY